MEGLRAETTEPPCRDGNNLENNGEDGIESCKHGQRGKGERGKTMEEAKFLSVLTIREGGEW